MCSGRSANTKCPDDEYDDLLAEPIGIFDLKIIANGNSLIFFLFLPQPIMFADYV